MLAATYANFRSFIHIRKDRIGGECIAILNAAGVFFFYKTFKVGLKLVMFFVTKLSVVDRCNFHMLLFLSDE